MTKLIHLVNPARDRTVNRFSKGGSFVRPPRSVAHFIAIFFLFTLP